jgi:hypothetical protein
MGMRRKETIDERLARLNRELDETLGKHQDTRFADNINDLDKLLGLGLTIDEAKYWLENEPSFTPSDDSYHEPSNRRRVTRTPNSNS